MNSWFSEIDLMINRDSRGHLYSNDRGEILGPFEDKLLRKHLTRMFKIGNTRGSWKLESVIKVRKVRKV